MAGSHLQIGLIGTGFGLKVHLPQWRAIPGVEVRMICSASSDRAARVARDHAVPEATDDYRELIASEEVDLVDVATHADRHFEIARAALAEGKHVVCEKPLALLLAQARELVDAAAAAGVVNAVCHQHRYLTPRGRFRQLVADGYLGEPRYVAVTTTSDRALDPSTPLGYWGPYFLREHGGGVLNQVLTHYIDFVGSVFGDLRDPGGVAATTVHEKPVARQPVRTGPKLGPEIETDGVRAVDADDTTVVHARLDNDAPVVFVGSWVAHHGTTSRIEAHGSEGSLVLDGGTLLAGRAGEELAPLAGAGEGGDAEAPDLAGAFGVLARAVAAAATGSEASVAYPTFEDGLRVQAVVDAVLGE